jgi:hypothetical protein
MKKILLVVVFISINIGTNLSAQGVQICESFYGGNLWFTNYSNTNPSNFDTLSASQWSRLQSCNIGLIRMGGGNFNNGTQRPTRNLYYSKVVDNIREHSMEPMITVPLNIRYNQTVDRQDVVIDSCAKNAAEIVHLMNVVNKRNVKYFIIANEPGLDFGLYDDPFV